MKKKVFLGILGFLILLGFIFGKKEYFLYSHRQVFNAILNEDSEKITYWVKEKNYDLTNTYQNVNLIAYYLVYKKEKARTDFVKYLLDVGVKPDYGNEKNGSSLIWAIVANNTEIVKILVDRGADVNLIFDGVKPVGLALRRKNCEMVKYLLDKGAVLDGDKFESDAREKLKFCSS